MPKYSISLPEALGQELQKQHPGVAVSQVIQAALGGYLGSQADSPYGAPPDLGEDARRKLERLQKRLQREAATGYREGYENAIGLVDQIGWRGLDRLDLTSVGRLDRSLIAASVESPGVFRDVEAAQEWLREDSMRYEGLLRALRELRHTTTEAAVTASGIADAGVDELDTANPPRRRRTRP